LRRYRSRVIYRCRIIVPLHYNWAIVAFNVNRSGRRIVVMMMNPVLVVAITVSSIMPTVVVCQ
jgi:hypothetical protein